MEHPMEAGRAVGATVAGLLSERGISARSASKSTGIPLTTLSRRLIGASPLSVTELAALAVLLDTSVSDLVALSEKSIYQAGSVMHVTMTSGEAS